VIGGGFASVDDIRDARPWFIKEEHIKDIDGRRPSDPNYDPTTLFIPSAEWKNFTPAMHQYWEIKVHNMDKIFLFKLGKFYELFYQDAIICQRLLDLNWMGGAKKLHVGFPEKALDKYLSILVNNGFKVAVIEQTETPKMLEQRLKAEKGKAGQKSQKVVKREIVNLVTKGTYKDPNNTGYEPRYVLAFKVEQYQPMDGQKKIINIGVTFFDVATLKIYIGQFEDDEHLSNLRTLTCQIRPIEVIHERETANSDLIKMLKNSPLVPVFS
jgi:DNA mismatch repair protein MSH6